MNCRRGGNEEAHLRGFKKLYSTSMDMSHGSSLISEFSCSFLFEVEKERIVGK